MPLHADHEPLARVLDRLDEPVVGAPAGGRQPAGIGDALVVERVDDDHVAEDPVAEAAGDELDLVLAELGAGDRAVVVVPQHVGQVLVQLPPVRHGHQLHAAADAEQRQVFGERRPHEHELGLVPLRPHADRGVALLAVQARVDVGAAGEDDRVQAVQHVEVVGLHEHRAPSVDVDGVHVRQGQDGGERVVDPEPGLLGVRGQPDHRPRHRRSAPSLRVLDVPDASRTGPATRRRGHNGVTYAPVMPPSTRNVLAVMNEASSLARNATAAAISAGSANRPIGTCTSRRAARSGSLANSSISSGVATGPGHSALTRMPSRANCTPSSRVIASTPPLLAVYAICEVAAPINATKLAVLMIEPLPWRSMCGIAYLQHRYTLVRLTRLTRSQASSPVSRIEPSSGGDMPALLNATSNRPYRWATPSNSARTDASSDTSQPMYSPPTCSAAAFPTSAFTSTTTTFAPSSAKRRAVASPMPPPPPVMTDTRPSSRAIHASVSMKTFLTSVKAATESGPSSRPRPDCLTPPNGVQYRTEELELTLRLPVSMPRLTRMARPMSRVQIEPDRPYSVSLASATAASSSSNGSTETTGPKISSRQCRASADLASSTVGGYQ